MGILQNLIARAGYKPSADSEVLRQQNVELKEAMIRARNKQFASGVDLNWGKYGYEARTELTGTKKWDTLDAMEADPHIKGALRSSAMPLVNAEWRYEAASDKRKDKDAADLCNANLLRLPTDRYGYEFWVQSSWNQRLSEILQMLRDGFSMFGVSMHPVKGKWVYDRIQWLEPASVDTHGWVLDGEDNLVSVKRTFADAMSRYKTLEPLPAASLALYVWDLRGARFEGRPFVRSMYGPWKMKTNIQLWSAIWAQKVGSPIPLGTYPESWGSNSSEVDNFSEFVQAARGQSPAEAFGVFPQDAEGHGPKLEFAGAQFSVERGMTELTDSMNNEIAHGGGTSKGDMLGETQSGSRALGNTQGEKDMLMVSALSKIVSEFEMHGVANLNGMVERLVRVNFADIKSLPVLRCSKIDPDEGMRDVERLIKASQAGLVPKHPMVRQQVTEKFGLRLPKEAYEKDPEPPPMPPRMNEGGRPVEPGGGHEQTDERRVRRDDAKEVAAASMDSFKERLARLLEPVEGGAPGSGGRFPEQDGSGDRATRSGAGCVSGGRTRRADRVAKGAD